MGAYTFSGSGPGPSANGFGFAWHRGADPLVRGRRPRRPASTDASISALAESRPGGRLRTKGVRPTVARHTANPENVVQNSAQSDVIKLGCWLSGKVPPMPRRP